MDLVDSKTSELQGAALDWAVATIDYPGDGYMNAVDIDRKHARSHCITVPDHYNRYYKVFRPSTDWSQGGPLIERERIGLWPDSNGYFAEKRHFGRHHKAGRNYGEGPTPLIAAMRCLVAAELGDTVKVPEELLQ